MGLNPGYLLNFFSTLSIQSIFLNLFYFTSESSDSLSVATPNFGTRALSGPETLLAVLRVLLNPEICDMDSEGFSSMTSDGVTSLTVLLPAVPMLKVIQNNSLKYTQNRQQN